MLHLLLGTDWTANRDVILKRISDDVRNRRAGRVLIVPELISHETERLLCSAAGDTASRYAEVLTFSRLARRISESVGSAAVECLDEGGRVVAMAAAARQLSSRLKAYASVETKPEFLIGMIDGIDEFKRCCITAPDLMRASKETDGSLAQKLEELSLLMESYDSLCARGKRDPRDQMTWALEQLENGSFSEEHVFYIDGFPDFTRQHLAILEQIIRVCPDVTISLNCDRVDSPQLAFEKAGNTAKEILQCARRAGAEYVIEYVPAPERGLALVREKLFQGTIPDTLKDPGVHTYTAETPWQECLAAAHQVAELVQAGCRYRDISIVCTDVASYQSIVGLIFERMHIPVYQSGTEDILQESIIVTVLNALDAALGGFEQRATLRYLRSALSPLDQDVCDLVENYAITWAIHGSRWCTPWSNHPDGLTDEWDEAAETRLKRLNDARELAIAPLEHLRKTLHEAVNVREQVLALYGFLEEIHLALRLSELADRMDADGDNRSAQILNQLWEILLLALEQMYDILGETRWEPEHFVRLLRLLLSQYDVGTIPPVLDAVQMGPVSAMRCHSEKHLIILGTEEGKLPGYSGSNGVLTDQERGVLRGLGIPLTGGAMEGIQSEFAEIYGVFCGAEESISLLCAADKPSYLYRRLSQLSGGMIPADTTLDFASADSAEAGAWLARWDEENLAARLDVKKDYDEICSRRSYTLGKIAPRNIRGIYGDSLRFSASQVDTQADCRLEYFLKYGLRLKERKEATVDQAEFGTYVHAVLEQTARHIMSLGGFHKVSLEQTCTIAHQYSDAYATQRFSQIDSERMSYLFQRNVRELDMVVSELWKELSNADFEPKDFEVEFGGGGKLAPIVIPNRSMNAILNGFVDRVDVWQSPGSAYYRVVDYKTGKKDFDYCDVYNGIGLQMLLYLFALENSGDSWLGNRAKPAGVQYFPARADYISAKGRLEDEETEKNRESQWKRKGLLLRDEAVLQAMEHSEKPSRMDYSIKKDGTISGNLADREQLHMLEKYVFRVLGNLVEDIASGCVDPNPYTRGSSHDACRFCPYGSVCHKATVQGRRSYKTVKAQQFWEDIERELSENG